jgi:hypothetical protein
LAEQLGRNGLRSRGSLKNVVERSLRRRRQGVEALRLRDAEDDLAPLRGVSVFGE